MSRNHILVVDDERLTRQSLFEILKFEGYKVSIAADGKEAISIVEGSAPDVIISDMRMAKMGGLELLKELKSRGYDIPMILMTGYATIESAVEAMKEGAFDYITKPIVDSEIKIVIQKILNQQKLIEENRLLKEQLVSTSRNRFHDIIGQDIKMQKIYSLIETVANTNATILLRGKSGTGKRLIAQAIHKSDSSRKDNAFIEVSCGALPESLLESELFGHVKGSFTGAIKDRAGRFELANKGVILLDEIDTFSPKLQVKLLRVLQSGEFERVGDTKTQRVDVRVIAATNLDLAEAIREGRFREDLYYRLNVISINIPSLSERKKDIPMLIEHFLKNRNTAGNGNKKITGVSDEALDILMRYEWPGNIRELENVIERATILAKGPIITKSDLPDLFHSLEEKIDDTKPGGKASLKDELKNSEKKIIKGVLDEVSWNRNLAAKTLGINRTTLYNKMREYGLLDSETE